MSVEGERRIEGLGLYGTGCVNSLTRPIDRKYVGALQCATELTVDGSLEMLDASEVE